MPEESRLSQPASRGALAGKASAFGWLSKTWRAAGPIPLFVLAHFSHHVLTAMHVPLLALIRDDFNLDYTQSGLIVSAFSLAYGISQLPAGWLSDRINPRIVATFGICGVALAGLFVGLSNSFWMLIIFLVMLGTAGGGYHPAASPLISAEVEPKNRGRALGFHMIGGGTSFFLAPLMAVGIASVLGWRGPFVVLSIPSAAFGVIFYIILRRRARVNNGQVKAQDGTARPQTTNVGRITAFIVMSAGVQSLTNAVIAFFPLFLVDIFGLPKESSGAYISIIYIAGLWVGPVGGYLSDRLGRIPVLLAVCLACGPILYALTLVPFGATMWALLLLLGITMYIRMPVSEAFVISSTPSKHVSTVLGIYQFAGIEAGGILAPVMGILIDRYGFESSFTMAGIAALVVTVLAAVFLRGEEKQSEKAS